MESTYRRLKWGENFMDTMDDKYNSFYFLLLFSIILMNI